MRVKATKYIILLGATALMVALAPVSAQALPPTGALSQLPGTAGCVGSGDKGGTICAASDILRATYSTAASPDGTNVYAASTTTNAVVAFSRDPLTGALTQLPGVAGCISQKGASDGCTQGKALSVPKSVTVSPDGRNVYLTSLASNAVDIFARNPSTGTLTQLADPNGCIVDVATTGCTTGKALKGATWVTVSGDGANVYVASNSSSSDSVTAFRRDTSDPLAVGKLTQLADPYGCILNVAKTGCTTGKALDGATSVTASADGVNVYVASNVSDSVTSFKRSTDPDPTKNGKLSQLSDPVGCITNAFKIGCTTSNVLDGASSVTVSPDPASQNVYVASQVSNAVKAFTRDMSDPDPNKIGKLTGASCVSEDGTGGSCSVGVGLSSASSVAVSPDGQSVYVGSFPEISSYGTAVAAFSRRSSGALDQLTFPYGCLSDGGWNGTCTNAKVLDGPQSVTVSPDGSSVYAAAYYSNAIAVFSRRGDEFAPTCTDASATAAASSSTVVTLSCADPNGDPVTLSSVSEPSGGALSAIDQDTGTVTYSPGPGFSGTDTFTFQASDGVMSSNVATANVTVLPSSVAVATAGFASIHVSSRSVKLMRGALARVGLSCAAATAGDTCDGTVTLRTAKRVKVGGHRARLVTLGGHAFSIPAGQSATVAVRLSKVNQRLIKKLKRVRVKATATFHGLSGSSAVSSSTITLKA